MAAMRATRRMCRWPTRPHAAVACSVGCLPDGAGPLLALAPTGRIVSHLVACTCCPSAQEYIELWNQALTVMEEGGTMTDLKCVPCLF